MVDLGPSVRAESVPRIHQMSTTAPSYFIICCPSLCHHDYHQMSKSSIWLLLSVEGFRSRIRSMDPDLSVCFVISCFKPSFQQPLKRLERFILILNGGLQPRS